MKILFISAHSIYEYDMMRIFTEIQDPQLNIEIFSLLGSYMNPTQAGDYLRSVIPHGRHYPELYGIALQCDKDRIHPELVDWADVILMSHNSRLPNQEEQQPWLVRNWKLFEDKKKKVVWLSIGQSTPEIEKELLQYRKRGLKIVRYSPIEARLPEFAGQDAVIRFGKDESEYGNWTGEKQTVITLAQSFKKRGDHLRYDIFEKVTEGFNRKVYGNENADLGEMWGGTRSYEELKRDLREARVFYYFGTIPAPYTLSFIEAMLTGIPIVAVGKTLRKHNAYQWDHYEIPEIIINGVNGFFSDDINELKGYIKLLMVNHEKARSIGQKGRETAIKLFSNNVIKNQWRQFLLSL